MKGLNFRTGEYKLRAVRELAEENYTGSDARRHFGEIETPKALRGRGIGDVPLPSQLEALWGSVVSSQRGTAENGIWCISSFKKPMC